MTNRVSTCWATVMTGPSSHRSTGGARRGTPSIESPVIAAIPVTVARRRLSGDRSVSVPVGVLRAIAIAPRMPTTTAPRSRASQRRRSVSARGGTVCEESVRAQNALSSSDANPLAYSTSPARGTVGPHETVSRDAANIDPWLRPNITARARRLRLAVRTSVVSRSAWNAVASTTNRTASGIGVAHDGTSAATATPATKVSPPAITTMRWSVSAVPPAGAVLISVDSEQSARAPPPTASSA